MNWDRVKELRDTLSGLISGAEMLERTDDAKREALVAIVYECQTRRRGDSVALMRKRIESVERMAINALDGKNVR